MTHRLALLAPALLFVALPGIAVAATPAADALQLLKESVSFRTVEGQSQVPAFAQFLARRLEAGGIPAADIKITPMGETATLVARFRGTGAKRPLVISAHMDVVEARAADWERDPFTPIVENGYLFGRGSDDNKFDLAMIVTTIRQLKAEGFEPARDIILALSGDEETSMRTTRVLAKEFPDAEFVLNGDGGGGKLDKNGNPVVYDLQAGEKTYADFDITFTNPGGHSSRPSGENAIAQLARAIDRIAAYHFPPQRNELTRASLKATGERTSGPLGAAMIRFAETGDAEAAAELARHPDTVGQIGTTCVPTMLRGGHAHNALPQSATVSVNCRIFPGVSVESVRDRLVEVVADPQARVTVLDDPAASDASPLRADIVAAVTRAVHARAPGLPIVPSMSAGATDSLHFRAAGIPSYGVSALFMRSEDSFAHGLNERVPLSAIDGALVQWHVLLTELAK
ncbi:MAG: M20/M25/M40 family metallo-hydrolase [Steroidobacteraceae bacterium]|nr:M20/M25/M40 family metallo-hydrolase [Steroidobacteraceae bacterium]